MYIMYSSSDNNSFCTSNMDPIDLNRVPLSALRIKTRTQLSKYLNPLQVIPTRRDSRRDFRGLADCFKLDATWMNTIERSNDPMKLILGQVEKETTCDDDNYEQKRPYNFQDLVNFLEIIERFDVVDDLIDLLKDDASFYNDKMQKLSRKGLTRPRLTVDDVDESDMHYDAYICYADEDIDFVVKLADFLEHPRVGLKLFLRDRDLLVGTMKYDAYCKLIETRCNYVVIILTPNFVQSEECKYQTHFATDLSIQDRTRKLIPLVYKQCEIPPFVKVLSKIDFSRGELIAEWIWIKLIRSISSQPRVIPQLPSYPKLIAQNNNALTYPANNDNQSQDSKQYTSTNPELLINGFKSSPTNGLKSSAKTCNTIFDSTATIESIPDLPSVPTHEPTLKVENLKDESFDSGRADTMSFNSSPSSVSISSKKEWKKGIKFLQSVKQKIVSPFASHEPSYEGYDCLTDCEKLLNESPTSSDTFSLHQQFKNVNKIKDILEQHNRIRVINNFAVKKCRERKKQLLERKSEQLNFLRKQNKMLQIHLQHFQLWIKEIGEITSIYMKFVGENGSDNNNTSILLEMINSIFSDAESIQNYHRRLINEAILS